MAFLGVFWYQFKTFIWKKYSKSKQTKHLGFVKLSVWWAEQDKWCVTYNLNLSCHLGFNVFDLTLVALINLACIGPFIAGLEGASKFPFVCPWPKI